MKNQKLLALVMALVLMFSFTTMGVAEVLTGEAEGFGGMIQAEVTVEDGKIAALTLTGEKETAGLGDVALTKMAEAIVAAGTVEGVDTVAGATWSSKGAIAAVNAAMGVEAPADEGSTVEAVSASGLKHGLGVESTPRLGPGADANGVGVYSFNEVVAYVVVDSDNRIVDLEVDIVEIISPNHDESNDGDNVMVAWPGQSYNNDAEGDGVVEGQLEGTEDFFTTETLAWQTKRQKGSGYKMNSGTWEQEMDIFENFFKGKTVEEIYSWYTKYCSDRNGRPLTAASTNEQDSAKFATLTDEEKTVVDAYAGATMSLTDPHGDILAAVAKAVENVIPMREVTKISKIGLGLNVMPRLGPGADDQGVPCYSINVAAAGVCYDENGVIVDMYCDVLEIITPNHDGADDNRFTGWPGQSYNVDENADAVVEAVWTQTEDTFVAQVDAFTTKRDLGSKYKMNAGTWEQEMIAFEGMMVGKTTEEVSAWFAACFSDRNGRPLRATSTNELDVAKYAKMTDEQKAEIDAVAGATMALRDPHGDILLAIEQADAWAKATDITVE